MRTTVVTPREQRDREVRVRWAASLPPATSPDPPLRVR